MNKLKIKAKIYQYTGIFLAYEEQSDYFSSEEFWQEFDKLSQYNAENEFDNCDLAGLMLGTWQATNGFHRRLSPLFGFKALFRAAWYIHVLAWLHVFYLQLINDLKGK